MYNGCVIPLNARHVADVTGPKPLSPQVNERLSYGRGRCECRWITLVDDRMMKIGLQGMGHWIIGLVTSFDNSLSLIHMQSTDYD